MRLSVSLVANHQFLYAGTQTYHVDTVGHIRSVDADSGGTSLYRNCQHLAACHVVEGDNASGFSLQGDADQVTCGVGVEVNGSSLEVVNAQFLCSRLPIWVSAKSFQARLA